MIRMRQVFAVALFAAVGFIGWLISANTVPEEALVIAPMVGFASFGIGAQLVIFGRTNVRQLVKRRKS